ncbi:DUF1205 domain-containing protein [Streptomyces pimonensis]|uniref:DUF1205 domain-containing protein n=1 Tax=Streptomyces pimonensis TaxID=2860288 RepID=A0ABV4J8Q7_9ACTN
MKYLFLTGGSPATVFAFAPLATALRNAGHTVFVATIKENVPVVEGVGLSPVDVATMSELEILSKDGSEDPERMLDDPVQQMRLVGRWYGRMARGCMTALTDLVGQWSPDVIVGGRLTYAGQLLAVRLGTPYVRHPWGLADWSAYDVGGGEELAPELRELGLDRLPLPDMTLDICPPVLLAGRTGPAEPGTPMRWTPANLQRHLEPWMYVRGKRPRICVTTGTRVTDEKTFAALGRGSDFLRTLVTTATKLDAEILVAAPEEVVADLRAEMPEVRAGWIPLDVVAPTCDVIVSHGGTNTSMVALNAGVPQLNIAKMYISEAQSRLISDFGAGVTVPVGEASEESVTEACGDLLNDPRYRRKAQEAAADMAALPLAAELVGRLEALVADRAHPASRPGLAGQRNGEGR